MLPISWRHWISNSLAKIKSTKGILEWSYFIITEEQGTHGSDTPLTWTYSSWNNVKEHMLLWKMDRYPPTLVSFIFGSFSGCHSARKGRCQKNYDTVHGRNPLRIENRYFVPSLSHDGAFSINKSHGDFFQEFSELQPPPKKNKQLNMPCQPCSTKKFHRKETKTLLFLPNFFRKQKSFCFPTPKGSWKYLRSTPHPVTVTNEGL